MFIDIHMHTGGEAVGFHMTNDMIIELMEKYIEENTKMKIPRFQATSDNTMRFWRRHAVYSEHGYAKRDRQ